MTKKEKIIYEIIRVNPYIQQEELAKMLNSSRSSVATHILNLQRKGYILGRAYITNEEKYSHSILVIGGSNMDIQGKPSDTFNLNDSNPGEIVVCEGGVGRNIADNVSHLCNNVKFITAIGDDNFSNDILSNLLQKGINVSDIYRAKDTKISTYLSILDDHHEMIAAISDMDLIENITADYLSKIKQRILNYKVVILDTNLSTEALSYITSNLNHQSYSIVDLVSTKKATKIIDILDKLHTIKANKLEAEKITGFKIKKEKDLIRVGKWFIRKGVKRIFITLASEGVFYMEKGNYGIVPNPKLKESQIVNVTGAGDAFTSGIAYATLNNLDIVETTQIGLTMSYMNLSVDTTVVNDLNEQKLLNMNKKLWKGK